MATENLLMAAVQAGGDRQDLHERIRVHAMAASEQLKNGAARNDLLDRIRSDPAFPRLDFEGILDPSRYTGRSAQQVDEFVANDRSSRFAAAIPHRREPRPGFGSASLTGETLPSPRTRSFGLCRVVGRSRPFSDPRGHVLASLA